jgi:hypothetical protein
MYQEHVRRQSERAKQDVAGRRDKRYGKIQEESAVRLCLAPRSPGLQSCRSLPSHRHNRLLHGHQAFEQHNAKYLRSSLEADPVTPTSAEEPITCGLGRNPNNLS